MWGMQTHTYFLMTHEEEQVETFCKKSVTNLSSECGVITQNPKLLFALIGQHNRWTDSCLAANPVAQSTRPRQQAEPDVPGS